MTDLNAPTMADYPGYFPASKPPFWSRTKVGAAAGMGGLILGLGIGGFAAAADTAAKAPATSAATFTEADVAQAVDDAVGDAVNDAEAQGDAELEDQEAQAAERIDRIQHQAAVAQRQAIAKVRAEARARTARAVAQARSEARSAALASVPTQASTGTSAGTGASASSGTDPQFSYCYEANDAGYGPYYQGQDPEYAWYDDADGDGVVCE